MPSFVHEEKILSRGHKLLAGVDEAGRGPLAGPVVAAAVILPRVVFAKLDDSKKLSKVGRERLFEEITSHSDVRWSVAMAEVEEIDRLNILNATHLAMKRALEGLPQVPDIALIDGLPVKGLAIPHEALVKGDGLSFSIAAASIIAKVSRDRWMLRIDEEFPVYGFAKHQGYGTRAHLEALRVHGPCRHHRRSFKPVSQLTLSF